MNYELDFNVDFCNIKITVLDEPFSDCLEQCNLLVAKIMLSSDLVLAGCGNCSSGCGKKYSGSCCGDDCDDDCRNEKTAKKQTKSTTVKYDGAFCRSCNEWNEYAEPDGIINDHKFTCFVCGNHPDRKKIGLPEDKVKEVDKIYQKK